MTTQDESTENVFEKVNNMIVMAQADDLISMIQKPLFVYRMTRSKDCDGDPKTPTQRSIRSQRLKAARELRDVVHQFTKETL